MEQNKYTPGKRAQVRFRPDPAENPAPSSAAAGQARQGKESGSSFKGNRSRSGRAAAPTTDMRAERRTAILECPRCGWSKEVAWGKVIESFRGHYGYAHPERRLPSPGECFGAVIKRDENAPHCPTCSCFDEQGDRPSP